jgi:hypothetical protein
VQHRLPGLCPDPGDPGGGLHPGPALGGRLRRRGDPHRDLEPMPEPTQALAETVRLLRPAGLLYLATPQMWSLHYEPHDYFR